MTMILTIGVITLCYPDICRAVFGYYLYLDVYVNNLAIGIVETQILIVLAAVTLITSGFYTLLGMVVLMCHI